MWSKEANGRYTVTMQANEVADTLGVPVAAGKFGSFTVHAAPDRRPPKASLAAANVTTSGQTSYTFTVTYTDNVEVNASTLGDGDVRVTGPKGYSQQATLIGVDFNTSGTPRTATYRITPPDEAWTAANNGVYTVSMQRNQVADTSGNAVAARKLGTFTVDTDSPKASLSSPDVTKTGVKSYTFTVTYSDNLAVKIATLDSLDIRVTGPNGYDQAATLVILNPRKNGTSRKATYRITPPGAAWTAADNGTYAVVIQANQVTDTSGNALPAGELGRFQVSVPGAAADRVYALLGSTFGVRRLEAAFFFPAPTAPAAGPLIESNQSGAEPPHSKTGPIAAVFERLDADFF
jgi:hypothetical protein